MKSPHRTLLAAALLAAASLACAGPAAAQRQVRIGPLYPQPTSRPGVFPADTSGLRFRLDQVVGSTAVSARPARATGRLLTVDESRRLLARLAPLRVVETAADSFAFPAQTLPPPRAGRVVTAAFPARDSAAVGRPVAGTPAAAPLGVVRRAPEGEVDVGAEVTITFSQAMVPLGSVSDVAAQTVPARITPAAPGRWRWIDVRTLKFEPRGRLPMATTYTVEIPAGTRGAAGAPLPEAIRWTFATPAARAVGALPQGAPTRLTPVLAVAFDQRVSPAAVLRGVRVRANGGVVPVRLATAAEVAAAGDLGATLASYPAGRTVAFRPVAPLPRNAQVRVSVGPGTPSAEGPRVTDTEQFWEFRTYGPLRITNKYCGCRPGEGFNIELSNTLDAKTFSERMVTVQPAIPGMSVFVSGSSLYIGGDTRPSTRYTVRVDPALRDEFGQALGPSPAQTFDVGLPYARLNGPEGMIVLDPLGEPSIAVSTQGHARLRLRVQRVEVGDWARFGALERHGTGAAVLPGRTVHERVITVDPPLGNGQEIRVDVSPALAGGIGQAVVAVEALDGGSAEEREQAVYTWVQGTRIGVTAFSDAEDLLVWATSLVDGSPVAGAEVRLERAATQAASGTTDASGLATLALPTWDDADAVVVVRNGADVAILPKRYGSWARNTPSPNAAWYAFTDRNLYRPGETVRFKGWVRRIERTKGGGVDLLRPGTSDSVAWTAFDARHNRIAQGTAALTALGGFDAQFTVPAGANLGSSQVELALPRAEGALASRSWVLQYDVQEFRRPEYTVSASASDGPHFLGGSAEVTVRAAYFAGGPLAAAPVHWNVTATPGSYSPPGWDEWSFGDGAGWLRRSYARGGGSRTQSFDGGTNASGENVLRIAFTGADAPRPYTVRAEATVTDVNRQTWSASAGLLVHPSAVYAGMRTKRAWLSVGDSIDLDLVAVDVDGKPVPGRTLDVRAVRHVWKQVQGNWEEAEEAAGSCARVSEPQPVRCVFAVPVSGRYEVTATVTDAQGRPNRTSTTLWVAGPGGRMSGPSENGERGVELIPDRTAYAVGDTARILVRTAFAPSVGLLTTRVNGLALVREVRLQGSTATFAVPITEASVPNVNVQLDLVGAADGRRGEAARGVLYASGAASLSVPPVSRTLSVKPLPRDTTAAPDAATEVAVEVRDAAGRPVANAEVALVVVDEAVLALTGYRIGHPLDAFYRQRESGVQQLDLRDQVRVVAPDWAPEPHALVGRVVDARNGGYLAGAVLVLDGSRDTARTDEAGRFRITRVAAGAHRLTVSMDGYAIARVSVTVEGEQAPAPLRVSLVPQALKQFEAGRNANGLAGVVARGVTADRMQMMVAEAPMAMSAPPPPPPPSAAIPTAAEPAAAPIAIRTNFDPLALFAPVVRTDASGRAVVPFTLPSNLTRYRVTAVAVEGGTRYGLGESGITARQPLMVRPSAPRFLNWGDRFELPVVVQNQTGAPLEVDVAARGTGVNVTETGWRVTVPAHDRVEVRLAAEAGRAGPAQVQVGIASTDLADAAEISLPVYTPATAEAFATYGSFTGDSAVTLPLRVPGDAIPSFGGLEVSASSTALNELTDALLYLVRYPYECAEQIASRMLGVTALRDVLQAFKAAELPPPAELQASVDRDVRDLAGRQNGDGGFGFWKRGDPSYPYVSIHAAHALQRAREKGYAVPDDVYAGALRYLRVVPGNLPPTYPPDVRRALHAYALYVRARMGDAGAAADVRRWVERTPRDSVTVEEAGWLISAAGTGPALADVRGTLLQVVNNRATETASTATFATRYTEGELLLLHSQRRTDGVVLEALVGAQPDNPLVPKVVRGLLGHRVQGRWDNTQENAWVLIALDRYFHAFEGQTPEFVARAWLGERFAGSHAFNGRQGDRWQLAAPMRVLQEQRPESITLGKEGPGRLYYRAGLRYAPRDLDLLPLDAGFVVGRTYEAVDDPRDVVLGADGQWRVKAGARVRVTVTMTAPSRRLHVALVDPLPAGFEPVNPELQGSQQTPPATSAASARTAEWGWWWRMYWYEHQNLRDDRAEAFTSLLPAGTYTYSYVARATTPGRFIVPPPHAEEMYSPETFGRGKTERVTVVPADQQ